MERGPHHVTRTPTLILIACATLLVSGTARAATPVIPLYHASYAVNRNDFRIGTATFSLTRNPDGSYTYQSVTRATGLAALFFSDVITETSEFTLNGGHVQAQRYAYTHSNNDHDAPEHIRFDWKTGSAQLGEGKSSKSVRIASDTYDRALAQLAISLDLAAGKPATNYTVLDHGKLTHYRMQQGKDTQLHTPDGNYQVIELLRKNEKKKRTTTLWLAPKLDYLPVKIKQTEPGKATITLTLTSIKFDMPSS
ncbi:MAG TPA: DUF3108 domain-containing protein [Gammaproteobacteria bacterium]|nr:DUF3108 domain-containing protein [Gammaproteobacteria bacterium]